MRLIVCLAVIAGVGLIAGCGGSGTATRSLDGAGASTGRAKAEFVKKANRLCAEFNASVDAVLPQTPGDTSHVYEAFMFRIQSLAPHDMQGRVLVADGFNVSQGYADVENAIAKKEGRAAVAKAKAAVGVVKTKFDRAARAFGLTMCASGRAYAPRPAKAEFPYPGRFGVD